MDKRYISLSVIFALLLVTGLSMAEDPVEGVESSISEAVDDTAADAAEVADEVAEGTADDETEDAVDDAAEDIADQAPTDSVQTVNAKGIWRVNLGESSVTMAIYQSEDALFGAAKSEDSTPWNALVMGSISGDKVSLTMTSIQDNTIVSTKLEGTVANNMVNGAFVQASSLGEVSEDTFNGFQINPDPSAYTPAEVAKTTTKVETAFVAEEPETQTETETADTEDSSRFVDVAAVYGDTPFYASFAGPGMT